MGGELPDSEDTSPAPHCKHLVDGWKDEDIAKDEWFYFIDHTKTLDCLKYKKLRMTFKTLGHSICFLKILCHNWNN